MQSLPYTLLVDADPIASLRNLAQYYPQQVIFSTSFSYEDQLIAHWILSEKLPIRIFTLDTGRMFAETYEVLHRTNQKYDTHIEVFFPEANQVEAMVNKKGLYSFYESVEARKECCHIRKVVPLQRALKGMACWVTGIRAEHSENRQTMEALEWDAQNNLVKYHPLLHWSTAEVTEYVKANQIPYNSLHDKGFPSIGCQPCTRAIKEGENIRAGRWWWEDTSKKECGLHS